MKRILILAMVAAISLGLGACENVRADINNSLTSLQRDFGIPTQSTETTQAAQAKPAPLTSVPSSPPPPPLNLVQAETSPPLDCPEVRIVSDLNQVHQFTRIEKPSEQEGISSIWMRDVQSQCTAIEGGNVAIDITMAFEGSIGPKGRLRASDNPGFSYPYFVATTTNEGSIIAKEVFAITLSYDNDEKTRTKIEKVRQVIPADGRDYKNYRILIGFQLNDQELAFNRMQAVPLIEPVAGIP